MSPFSALAICFASSMAAATTLVIFGHPWFATLAMLIAGSLSVSRKDDTK